jgi:hypothetical protein
MGEFPTILFLSRAVPEPNTLLLMTTGAVLLIPARRLVRR